MGKLRRQEGERQKYLLDTSSFREIGMNALLEYELFGASAGPPNLTRTRHHT